MRMQTPRLYYGWIIVAISCLTMMCVMGVFSSSGVLLVAISTEYGWSRATTSLPFSIALIAYAATAWLGGRLFDRYGPRRLFPAGLLCLGLGVIACSRAQTPWHLCLSWGVLVGQGFNLAGFVPLLAQVALWFHRRRGLAAGVVLSGGGLGALVVVPCTQYLVNLYGWRTAYLILGLVVIGVLIPLNAIWQRHRPADLGLQPDGAARQPTPEKGAMTAPDAASWTLRQAVTTVRFWYLFVMVSVIGWLSNITIVHQIAHITDNGFPTMLAASAVGLMGLMRVATSTVWGGLSDRLGREKTYIIGNCLCISGLACLVWLDQHASVWLLYGYILAFGLGYAVHGATEVAVSADIFQGPHLGAILGTLELGWGMGGFAGAWFGGYWYDHWGSYHGAFGVTIGLCLLGCLALWLAAPRRSAPLVAPSLRGT